MKVWGSKTDDVSLIDNWSKFSGNEGTGSKPIKHMEIENRLKVPTPDPESKIAETVGNF